MFSRLPESKPARQRRLGGVLVSTAVHLVFIALAVRATGLRADPAPETTPLVTIYRVAPPEAKPTIPRTKESGSTASPLPPVPRGPIDPIVRIDVDDVTGIPEPGVPIDLTRRGDFDPTATATSGGPPGGTPNVADGSPLPEHLVDKPVLAIPGTTPRYPAMLQSAGVEGDVRAQFVVDTLGRVEQGSVRILDATHALFASAVRDALSRMRFKAAEAGGHKVRQLAEQVFTFRIER